MRQSVIFTRSNLDEPAYWRLKSYVSIRHLQGEMLLNLFGVLHICKYFMFFMEAHMVE